MAPLSNGGGYASSVAPSSAGATNFSSDYEVRVVQSNPFLRSTGTIIFADRERDNSTYRCETANDTLTIPAATGLIAHANRGFEIRRSR